MNTTQDPAGSRLAPTTSSPDCITVRVKTENYGKGCPGYNTEVTLWDGDTRIARAFGPNTNGWCIGEFVDLAAVRTALAWGDGATVEAEAALALLWRWHAEAARTRRANKENEE